MAGTSAGTAQSLYSIDFSSVTSALYTSGNALALDAFCSIGTKSLSMVISLLKSDFCACIEPKIIVVTDPRSDSQAILESKQNGIPVIALCDTENLLSFVDIAVPVNNKGRKAIALVYWLLARQILRERGDIAEDADLDVDATDFELKF